MSKMNKYDSLSVLKNFQTKVWTDIFFFLQMKGGNIKERTGHACCALFRSRASQLCRA
jgi:hypothetical protein